MASLDTARDRLLAKLSTETPFLEKYDLYFEGDQELTFLSPALKSEMDGRISEIVYNLPRFAVGSYENRLDIEGFRFSGRDSTDDDLWEVFQYNDGDMLAHETHQESLALSRSYVLVGEGDSDVPLLTPESSFLTIHENDPRTKDVAVGLKTWTDFDDVKWSSVYHPNGRETWRQKDGDWTWESREENDFGVCRLVPMVNDQRLLARPRAGKQDLRLGRSVFHDIIPVSDAINKMLTDMMVSGEFHAMPRRWAVGLSETDFTDEYGEALKTWELIAGRIWASENKDVKMGQFDEADLVVFHTTIKLLMQLAAQLLGLPPHYLAFVGANPSSADAIRSSEVQLVKRVERIQKALSTRWERVQRLVLLTQGYPDSADARQIETIWRDPSTPTVAQKADAVVKMVTAKDGTGRTLIPIQQAREDLGFTATQRKRMEEWDRENSVDPQLAAALRDVSTASGNPSGNS